MVQKMPSKKVHNTSTEKSDESLNNTDLAPPSYQDLLADPRFKAMHAYQQLPTEIRRRVKSLKKLQHESFKIEADFFRRMNELEREFQERFSPIYTKRAQIVTGEKEPTESECDWNEEDIELLPEVGDKEVSSITEGLKNHAVLNDRTGGDHQADTSSQYIGIPNFWLTVFNNVPMLADSKEEFDDAILASLRDIICFIQPADAARPGFYLEFHFAPNEYFTNTILKKEYFVRFDPSVKDPLEYEGPEIIESKGCAINWKQGKNVTIRTIKKTMKNKSRGEKKTVTKTVKTDSFFNFFDPPHGCLDNLDEQDEEDDLTELLHADFELGQYIREQVIPRAVMLYTGEGIVDEDEDFDSEGEEEEDDDNDEPSNRTSGGRGGHRRRGNSGEEQQCKQQ